MLFVQNERLWHILSLQIGHFEKLKSKKLKTLYLKSKTQVFDKINLEQENNENFFWLKNYNTLKIISIVTKTQGFDKFRNAICQ